MKCWCGHPKTAHWEAGGCRVTGCGCQQYDDGMAVQDVAEPTVLKIEIPPGYRVKVEYTPGTELKAEDNSGDPEG